MAGPGEFTKEQMAQLTKAFNPTSEEVMMSPIARLAAQTELFDKQRKAFAEAGYSRDMEQLGNAFNAAAEQSFKLFGNLNRAELALDAFSKSSRGFVFMADNMRDKIVQMATAMQGLGFEATTLAEVVDSGMFAFGSSAEQLKGLMDEFANMSRQLAIPGETLAQNFRKAQQDFAYNAEIFKKNFRDLQIMSRETGLSFDALTSTFGKSFDSFEGAAQKAGQLNQILGRSAFNSIELLNMTEAQRAEEIKKQFAGRDASQMGKFELLAIQDTLGFGSVEDTRKFLRTGSMPGGVDEDKYKDMTAGIDNIKKGGDKVGDQLNIISQDIRRARGPIENALVELGNGIQTRVKSLNAQSLGLQKILEARLSAADMQTINMDDFQRLTPMQQSYISTLVLKAGTNPQTIKAILSNIDPETLTGLKRGELGLGAEKMTPALFEKLDDLVKKVETARAGGDTAAAKKAEKEAMAGIVALSAAVAGVNKIGGLVEDFSGIPKAITAIAGLEMLAKKLDTATVDKVKESVGTITEGIGAIFKSMIDVGKAFEDTNKNVKTLQTRLKNKGPKSER